MSCMYRLVRLNTREHSTRGLALADMAVIIGARGYWTQNDDPPVIALGTPLVGMGSYGGRGLFLHGVAIDGEWEPTGETPFQYKLGVAWANVIYDVPGNPDEIGALVAAFNQRSWSRMTQSEYRAVLDRVLAGRALEPA